jgi:hydrogenase maturation protease
MSNPVIIGIGSPFGADRAGWDVIDYIDEHHANRCKLVKVDNAAKLLPYMNANDHVIMIDAIRGRADQARIVQIGIDDIADTIDRFSSHGIGIADVLRLATTLGQLPERLMILGLNIGDDKDIALPADDVKLMAGMVLDKAGLLEKEPS